MKALEEKIVKEGTVLPGNVLKVGSFLNQQMDSDFIMEIGKEIARLYEGTGVTRIHHRIFGHRARRRGGHRHARPHRVCKEA